MLVLKNIALKNAVKEAAMLFLGLCALCVFFVVAAVISIFYLFAKPSASEAERWWSPIHL